MPDQASGSPDRNAAGLVAHTLDPLRYDVERSLDPYEVPGIVAKMIPSNSAVLDVGCGTGTLALALSAACHAEFVGIEPDHARAARAAERGLRVIEGTLDPSLACELGRFDIVLLADVLEHLPNPQAILLTCREFLKTGGAIVVSVPNVGHWSVRSEVLQGRFRYNSCGIMDATHLRWFTAESVRQLVASTGFRVVEYHATAGFDAPDNMGRAPLCWLPGRCRNALLRLGSQRWPTLLGTQHVLKAEMV